MEEYKYKIVFIGESGTGAKTSLISRLCDHDFTLYTNTTSVPSYTTFSIKINLGIINLELWDTPGQEKYRKMNKLFIKNFHCIILGYDITNKHSFDEIKKYHYNNIKDILGDESLIYLVANKIDLYKNEKVPEEEAKDYAKEKGIKFFKVSAYTGEGVHNLFEDIIYSLLMKFNEIIDDEDTKSKRKMRFDKVEFKRLNNLKLKRKNEIILNKYYNY